VKTGAKVCGEPVDKDLSHRRASLQTNKDTVVKIDDSMKKAAGLGVSTTPTRAGKSAESKAATNTASPATESVRISPQLQTLASELSNNGVFDSGKVEEIKSAIAGGRFQVNAEKIADGLIDTVKDLIHSRKG
jgi:negative regulator of flagellin synthesis FlgM